ncbi:winged helix-turn-helix domain-containing protein, partial [Escherichia coli]|uniref:winged helix-turn-helix domain-containing protein n=1 Tax=Escherichia coli TaxID=562 RepID=UPI0013D2F12E
FLDRPGRVLSRDKLLDLTHGRNGQVLDRSVDVLISRLRRKLDPANNIRFFKTVRHGGYQLVVKVEVQEPPS